MKGAPIKKKEDKKYHSNITVNYELIQKMETSGNKSKFIRKLYRNYKQLLEWIGEGKLRTFNMNTTEKNKLEEME